MRRMAIFFFVLIVQIYSDPLLYAATLRASCVIRDLEVDRLVEKAKVVVDAEGEAKELSEKTSGRYEFAGKIAKPVGRLLFAIDPPKPFTTREIKLRVNRYKQTLNFNLRIFVLSDSIEVTHAFLNDGLPYFVQQEFEKALAHYEFAFRKKGTYKDIDDFYIKLNYSYARALHNVCTQLSYDTCSQAVSIADHLLGIYDAHAARFQRLGVWRKNLEDIKKDPPKAEAIRRYSEVTTLFGQGKYRVAAKLAGEMLEDAARDPEHFSEIGLSTDRLLVDVGVSYLKAAEQAEKEVKAPRAEIIKALGFAKEYLLRVQPDEKNRVRENLLVIDKKLKRLRAE